MSLTQMSVAGAVMIFAAIVVRALLLHRLPKRMFTVLWWIILVRLLIPFSLPCSFSAYSLLTASGTAESATGFAAALPALDLSGRTAPDLLTESTAQTVSFGIRTAVWFAGVLMCAAFFTISYFKCRVLFDESLPVDNEHVDQWLTEHRLLRRVSVRCSDRISAPLTYGSFRPVILLPKNFEQIDKDDLKFVLTHEYVHIRRFDVVFKLALTAALCVHWFNPLVWVMYIIANRDIELSCDEAVIRMLGEGEKSAYALTLIRMAEKKSCLALFSSGFGKRPIKERVIGIMKFKKVTALTVLVSACIVIGTTTAFATSARYSGDDTETLSDPAEMSISASIPVEEPHIPEMSAESTDNAEIPDQMPPAENTEEPDTEKASADVWSITLKPGEKIPNSDGAKYTIIVEFDENGNRIANYDHLDGVSYETMEDNYYIREEVIDGGIMRW